MVTRGDIGLLLGLAGFLLGGGAFFFQFKTAERMDSADNVRAHDGEQIDQLIERVTKLEEDTRTGNQRFGSHRKEFLDRIGDVAALQRRIEAIEADRKK